VIPASQLMPGAGLKPTGPGPKVGAPPTSL
jgi:hypothetical protein